MMTKLSFTETIFKVEFYLPYEVQFRLKKKKNQEGTLFRFTYFAFWYQDNYKITKSFLGKQSNSRPDFDQYTQWLVFWFE